MYAPVYAAIIQAALANRGRQQSIFERSVVQCLLTHTFTKKKKTRKYIKCRTNPTIHYCLYEYELLISVSNLIASTLYTLYYVVMYICTYLSRANTHRLLAISYKFVVFLFVVVLLFFGLNIIL